MNVPGETLTAWGRVTAIEERGEYGLATLAIGLRNERGDEGTPGTAVTVWPTREGPAGAVSLRPARARRRRPARLTRARPRLVVLRPCTPLPVGRRWRPEEAA